MGFTSRPRLIDRLRLFQMFSQHSGDQDAEVVVEILQDEFSPVATREDLCQFSLRLMTEIRTEFNAAILKTVCASVLIAGVALAIARLT